MWNFCANLSHEVHDLPPFKRMSDITKAAYKTGRILGQLQQLEEDMEKNTLEWLSENIPRRLLGMFIKHM